MTTAERARELATLVHGLGLIYESGFDIDSQLEKCEELANLILDGPALSQAQQGESVEVEAVGTFRVDEDGGRVEWLLEGGPAELLDGDLLCVLSSPALVEGNGHVTLYTAPPAPVADAVRDADSPESGSPWRPINELDMSDDLYWFARSDSIAGTTIDGPRPPQGGGYDADEWHWFCPAEAPPFRAALAAQPGAADGFVLVPKAPTTAMLEAGGRYRQKGSLAGDIWRAMLTAAQAQGGGDE